MLADLVLRRMAWLGTGILCLLFLSDDDDGDGQGRGNNGWKKVIVHIFGCSV